MSIQEEIVLFVGTELTKEEYIELFGDIIEDDFDENRNQSKLPTPLKYFWSAHNGRDFIGFYLGGMNDDGFITQSDIAYDDLFVVFVKTTVALRNLGIDRYPHLMFKDVSK